MSDFEFNSDEHHQHVFTPTFMNLDSMWGGRVEHFPGPSHFRAILDGWSHDHLFVHGCLIPVKFSGTHLLPENLGVTDVSEGRLVKYYSIWPDLWPLLHRDRKKLRNVPPVWWNVWRTARFKEKSWKGHRKRQLRRKHVPLKIDGWKMWLSFLTWSIFKCVNFGGCTCLKLDVWKLLVKHKCLWKPKVFRWQKGFC